MSTLGKTLIILGAVLVIAGIILVIFHRIPFLGKLPGDIYIKRERFTFYFPLASSIIISILISILLWIFRSK